MFRKRAVGKFFCEKIKIFWKSCPKITLYFDIDSRREENQL